MAKFEVGDKVRVIAQHYRFAVGHTFTITKIAEDGDLFSGDTCVHQWKVELVNAKPTQDTKRISALEKRIVELEAKVAALEKAQATPKTVPVTSNNIAVGDKVRFPNADRIEIGDDLTSGKLYEVVKRDIGSGFYVTDDCDDDLYIATYEFKYVEKVVSE